MKIMLSKKRKKTLHNKIIFAIVYIQKPILPKHEKNNIAVFAHYSNGYSTRGSKSG